MITAAQFSQALRGVKLMLSFDVRAWTFFERTPAGFWASFIVAVVLAPPYFAHVVLQFGARSPHLAFVPYIVVETLSYVLSWTLFPFVMMYLARLLQRSMRYFTYLVVYNWLQLPLGVFVFTVNLLRDFSILPRPTTMDAFDMAGLLAFFVYGTFIAAFGLQVGIGTALSLVVLDFILGLISGQLISRI